MAKHKEWHVLRIGAGRTEEQAAALDKILAKTSEKEKRERANALRRLRRARMRPDYILTKLRDWE